MLSVEDINNLQARVDDLLQKNNRWEELYRDTQQKLNSLEEQYNTLLEESSEYYNEWTEAKKQNERLKEELQNFQDMAKKGLAEFKDVGGCWGCGLQLQLNQDIKDIERLKAECDSKYRCRGEE